MEVSSITEMKDCLDKFEKIFDAVRVVNPRTGKVVYVGKGKDTMSEEDLCYGVWKAGAACDNCISRKSVKEKRVTTKIEYNNNGVMMVMASPIKIDGELHALELIKDITETKVLKESECEDIERHESTISELSQKAIIDELTGAYNRRYMNHKLKVDMKNAIRNEEKMTIIMLDIDNFKAVNDKYGHVVGDEALRALVKTIRSKIRNNYDWIARYGGDEFLILLKNANKDIAIDVMNNIVNAIESLTIKFKTYAVNITISAGAFTVENGHEDINNMIYEVDKNLKKAKQDGKNRIVAS